jgi:hypothetical protein
MAAPEGSFTTPSIEPEFPICAATGPAANDNANPNTKTMQMLNFFDIFSPSLRGLRVIFVDKARRKKWR